MKVHINVLPYRLKQDNLYTNRVNLTLKMIIFVFRDLFFFQLLKYIILSFVETNIDPIEINFWISWIFNKFTIKKS